MRSDTCTESKNMGELDVSLAQEKQNSFLEDDLALSSSAHGNFFYSNLLTKLRNLLIFITEIRTE